MIKILFVFCISDIKNSLNKQLPCSVFVIFFRHVSILLFEKTYEIVFLCNVSITHKIQGYEEGYLFTLTEINSNRNS